MPYRKVAGLILSLLILLNHPSLRRRPLQRLAHELPLCEAQPPLARFVVTVGIHSRQ